MRDGRAHCAEERLGLREGRRIAAGHDRERSVLGAHRSAGDRRVDEADADLLQVGMDAADGDR